MFVESCLRGRRAALGFSKIHLNGQGASVCM